MRKAKIISTLGPASQSIAQIKALILAGLDVARVNMSHGDHEGHKKVIENIRIASADLKKEVAILLDLQGPKIRVDKLERPLELEDESYWSLCHKDQVSKVKKKLEAHQSQNIIPTVYKNLVADAKVNDPILFDDGLIESVIVDKDQDSIKIKVITGGQLKSNKGINLPKSVVSAKSFTEKDENDLMFGLTQKIDYVALSFVRTPEDILEVKYLLHKLKVQTPIVAKIERPEAVENIEEMAKAADVIMIARGDMGVEVGNHLVPKIQKEIIHYCNSIGTPVITATQMLESMIVNSRPTRAEASDVANAVWDGTDALMLSGETASGHYPEAAVKMMSSIIKEAEKAPKERPLLRNVDLTSVSASIQVASSLIAEKTKAKLIISFTQTGGPQLRWPVFVPKPKF